MKLLRDKRAWRRFLLNDLGMPKGDADNEREPKEYPCFAYAYIRSFGHEELGPVYLYGKDVEKMVKRLSAARPAAA
jgi:hypothetical protein